MSVIWIQPEAIVFVETDYIATDTAAYLDLDFDWDIIW